MATGTRTPKTTAEIKVALAAAKKKVAMLEQKAYEGELTELIKAAHFVADYAAVKKSLPSVGDTAILSAIAKAVGAKRIQITQSAPAKRKPKGTGAVAKSAGIAAKKTTK
jgi:phosphohistidine phosphatase SixA